MFVKDVLEMYLKVLQAFHWNKSFDVIFNK